jgi:hypothetical protein
VGTNQQLLTDSPRDLREARSPRLNPGLDGVEGVVFNYILNDFGRNGVTVPELPHRAEWREVNLSHCLPTSRALATECLLQVSPTALRQSGRLVFGELGTISQKD